MEKSNNKGLYTSTAVNVFIYGKKWADVITLLCFSIVQQSSGRFLIINQSTGPKTNWDLEVTDEKSGVHPELNVID